MAADTLVQFHGIELLDNSTIKNFKIDEYAQDPINISKGRMWYNSTENAWKYSVLENNIIVIKYLDLKTDPTGSVLPLGWKALTKTVSYNNQYLDGPIWINLDDHHGNFSFQEGKNKGFFENFVIPFDCTPGTKLYPVIHWAPASTSTGNISWTINYNVSRGYSQSGYLNTPPITFQVTTTGTGKAFENQTTICSDAQAFIAPEPNSVVSFKLTRNGADILDTFVGDIYVVAISLMYKSDHETTPNNTPNFYKA